MSLQISFDFDALDDEDRIAVQGETIEFLEKVATTQQAVGTTQHCVIGMGQHLIRIKDRLKHGQFGDWLRTYFPWSRRTAQEFMSIAEKFKYAPGADLYLTHKALLALSSPSVPESARQEALNTAPNGRQMSKKKAQAIIDQHRTSTGTTDLPGQGQLFDEEGPEPGPESEEDEEESSSPSTPPPPARTVSPWKSDRILKHVRSALDRVDDVTRAVTAKAKNGGYGGIKASLARLTGAERLQLRAELENLIERLLRWTDQIEEKFDEAETG